MFVGHSKGLGLLFLTEMWERFSFYTLRALLVLYMVAKTMDGGLGWSRKEAISLYGLYIGAAYVLPVIGGYLSDRFLGQQRSAMIGAALMALGHFCMAFNGLLFFYSALTLVAIGNGFFKPCLTSILGQLYDDSPESQRDSAYSLFYMGINIGGMLAGFAAGWLLTHYGFDAGFSVAGIGMVIGMGLFWSGKNRYLGEVGKYPQVKTEDHHTVPLTSEEKSRLGVILVLFFYLDCLHYRLGTDWRTDHPVHPGKCQPAGGRFHHPDALACQPQPHLHRIFCPGFRLALGGSWKKKDGSRFSASKWASAASFSPPPLLF